MPINSSLVWQLLTFFTTSYLKYLDMCKYTTFNDSLTIVELTFDLKYTFRHWYLKSHVNLKPNWYYQKSSLPRTYVIIKFVPSEYEFSYNFNESSCYKNTYTILPISGLNGRLEQGNNPVLVRPLRLNGHNYPRIMATG